ncbi:MAG: oxygen-independent coproporphyrinogen III oxidase [Bdellovibrionaceae bacterium]|nr:oxygen-independent coproporphyrinogen III oxidase [Pseudobdellovibrionaceae bacterium]
MSTPSALFKKYDIPAPRYTSYPTVPYWSETPTLEAWLESLRQTLQEPGSKWSMYIHIPFCETLCTFCGCNTTITKNHKLENPYVARLLKEKDAYFKAAPDFQSRPLSQLHLGGGTPTFLSEEHLRALLQGLLGGLVKDEHFEGSIEVDPRRTRVTQLEVLREFGFNRVSLGVQDFDPEVQRLIHREQSFEQTKLITDEARRLGFTSVNFDLIYGLPKQNLTTISHMIEKTAQLRPDRIALYSFALVPWIKPGQRLFKDEDLPKGEEKRELYEKAREMLLAEGYLDIGMDHFALPSDELAKSSQRKALHRNFMGYTDQRTDILLGLGVSAISESPHMFFQNEKILPKFESLIDQTGFAPFRGHVLSKEDRHVRKQILELMTRGETSLQGDKDQGVIVERVQEMVKDGLARVDGDKVEILPEGRPFLRNLCLAFDRRFFSSQPETRIFSSSI